MTNFPIVDLIIGLIFIYFLLSIITSTIVELILTALKVRAEILEKWLMQIFDKNITISGNTVPLGQAIMDHCSVTALSATGKSTAYIDAKNFTSALLEKLSYDPNSPDTVVKDLNGYMKAIQDSTVLSTELKRVILTYAIEAKNTYNAVTVKASSDIDIFRTKIENWYDSSMDRITGQLKTKYIRPFTMIVAICTAIALNADSIAISQYLYSNPEVRAKMASKALESVTDSTFAKYQKDANSNVSNSAAYKQTQSLDTSDTTNKTIKSVVLLNAKEDSATNNIVEDTSARPATLEDLKKHISDIERTTAILNSNNLPIGWYKAEFYKLDDAGSWLRFLLSKLIGLAATAFAIFMGAPFWFDILNKIANLRGTGPKPAPANVKEDRNKEP